MDAQGTTKDQGPKVVAPTPAQITAIKVLDSLFLFRTQTVHVIIASLVESVFLDCCIQGKKLWSGLLLAYVWYGLDIYFHMF